MLKSRKTIDDVISFIVENIPQKETLDTKISLRRFHYTVVKKAIKQLHREGLYQDLMPYDITGTMYMWNTIKGKKNYKLARSLTKKLIKTVKGDECKPLELVLPQIRYEDFEKLPVNRFGTTCSGMIQNAYGNDTYFALIDLINNTFYLREFRDLRNFDMHQSNYKWIKEDGSKNFKLAREVTERFLLTLRFMFHKRSIKETIPLAVQRRFDSTAINKYGTKAITMLHKVYNGSPYQAITDWARSKKKFRRLNSVIKNLQHAI